MKILGIESSCDETAAAVVEDGSTLLSNVVVSQIDIHKEFGGVVPEVAARSHVEVITPVIDRALHEAFCESSCNLTTHYSLLTTEIDAIAVTQGPGLSGSLLIGTLAARTLAFIHQRPLYGIHHVLGHTYANFLTRQLPPSTFQLPQSAPTFPILALIVSGGHSQLVLFKDHFDYELLGQTRDDAVGEAFDKVAKIIGLPYPGGPSISKLAPEGNDQAYQFPIAKLDSKYSFSFSGLKTAVLRAAQAAINEDYSFPSYKVSERLSQPQQADIAASFQRTAIQTLVDATERAVEAYEPASLAIAGGVAANQLLRAELSRRIENYNIEYADIRLCTDNAAMIATLGYYQAQAMEPDDPSTLPIRPSWSM